MRSEEAEARLYELGIGEPERSRLAAIQGIDASIIDQALKAGDVGTGAPAGVAVIAIREHANQIIAHNSVLAFWGMNT